MQRPLFILALLLCAVASARDTGKFSDHPRILFNAQGIEDLKQRIAQVPSARDTFNRIKSRLDATLDTPVDLPPRGSNWYHWYSCPTHAVIPTRGRQIGPWQWEHICPAGKEILHGDPSTPSRDYDGCALRDIHEALAADIRDLGIVYQVSGDPRYAARARALLLAYADKYLTYPLHTNEGKPEIGGGRVSPQTLDESIWLIIVAQGADLIWPTLSDADRTTLADKLFLPAARDVILPKKLGIHNIQIWQNSAVGVVGFLLGNRDLIRTAIDDPERGFHTQLAKGVSPDGVWWEGAWGYHIYVLRALWPLTEAARNNGIDLYTPRLKSMFAIPIQLAMPNLNLPCFNDSQEIILAGRELFHLAYARYNDPIFLLPILTPGDGKNYGENHALWFGQIHPLTTMPRVPASLNAPDSGYAILRRGNDQNATWIGIKYGPHGGGHGHPDKNTFVLFAHNRVIGSDPGTHPYGSPLHDAWDKVTIAHNTLTVDQRDQAPTQGKSLAFGSDNGVDYSITDAGPIYPGLRFVRTVAMLNAGTILFIDRITADKPHTLDLALHSAGHWDSLPKGAAFKLPNLPGYKYLGDATTRTTPDGATLTLRNSDAPKTVITLAPGDPTQIITATGVGASTTDRIPALLLRRTAQTTTYVWTLSLDGSIPKLTTTESPQEIQVTVQSNTDTHHLTLTPKISKLTITH